MKWEELTAPEFERAVRTVQQTCLVPIGVIEKHGEHLPLGTDCLTGRAVAEAAVQIEPAIIFPLYYFGQIHEGKHQPGAIAVKFRLMFDLLDDVCEEIARNGLKKIVLLNGHGGNNSLLLTFVQSMLERKREYVVYLIGLSAYSPMASAEWKAMRETTVDGHAGELETSAMLFSHPDLVKMAEIADNGQPQKRCAHLTGLNTPISWYADYPNHYAGDGRRGTKEKGRFIIEYAAQKVAAFLKVVKADMTAPALQEEFHSRTTRC